MDAYTLKKIAEESLNSLGLEVRRRKKPLLGFLQQARNIGLSPGTIIDIGAAYGLFALRCHKVFPDAKYILVEPLEEFKPFLESVTKSIQGAEYILAAATAESGEIVINVHLDLVGSSQYLEFEESNVNGVPRTVRAVALDSLVDERMNAPFLIKVDVQGAELDTLLGAETILRKTEYVILEVELFNFFEGGQQFYDVVAFMKARGFVAYDIAGMQNRPLDHALAKVDIAFVKETGLFREHHYYATPKQREELNKLIRLRHELRLKDLSIRNFRRTWWLNKR